MNKNKLSQKAIEENKKIMKEILDARNQMLKNNPHINKYFKIRQLHNEISQSMLQYYYEGNYNVEAEIEKITPFIKKELNNNLSRFNLNLKSETLEDRSILAEIICYKTHPEMTSITEIYLRDKIYQDEDKIKMLEAMNNSYVGLFKVISTDYEKAYVELEDIFNKKRFKIIDIGGSLNEKISKSTYVYNRIITIDDISFGTGIHIVIKKDIREINNYIKNNRKKHNSDIIRCVDLYRIFKKPNNKVILQNNTVK